MGSVERDANDLEVLIVNAAQALAEAQKPGKGLIRIRSWEDQGRVICTVTNNGPVIPESAQDSLFNPFFTTKPPGKGTGLGLSISLDIIVRKHGGTLSFTSDENEGTTFRIVLPTHTPIHRPIHRSAPSEVRHE